MEFENNFGIKFEQGGKLKCSIENYVEARINRLICI